MTWRSAWWRFMTVLPQWLLLWLLTVMLGFASLCWAQGEARETAAAWPVLFLRYLGQIARGDLGTSARSGHPISEMVVTGLPVDLLLVGGALAVAWVLGALWGLLAAARANRLLGNWLMRMARGIVSVSVIALVPLCGLLVSSAARWSMIEGATLWLPMLALATPYAAQVARDTQRSALTTLASEVVLMARAKGVPRHWLWARYVAPVAWQPCTSFGRLPLASLLTSGVVIENLLGIDGTGRFFVNAAQQQDYAVVVGLAIVYCTLFIVANLGMDLIRDPVRSAHAADAVPMREVL